jgi:zinc and cadmium transporter
VAFGLTIHTLIDGVALAAAVQSEALHAGDSASGLLGIGVFLGVLLHKPLDALSITSVMHAGGWPVERRQLVNLGYALMCPLGALAFWFGTEHVFATHSAIVGCALAFAAGVFLCISLSDLLPELQFHTHDRVKLSVALLAGVLLAYLIGYLEPPHAHPGHPHDAHAHDHDHGAETAAQDAESEHDHTH